ncbi:uncharacterized protein KD926_006623 [Aspergillus affinis]|uniref:uncharacterized protein n=1 Tax=Aspergillus affinis TaxID=1070780 RepID=UPI0022FDD497|nr:uncharacterized protein KD926_006623 [Aspergillus affinis]KAI9041724.1 hypothetical protein KD926_006623 [Aspergillus affinis]
MNNYATCTPGATYDEFMKEVENYLGIYLLEDDARRELVHIKQDRKENVTDYYQRLVPLWTRAGTAEVDRILKLRHTVLTPISTQLGTQRFGSVMELLDAARQVERNRKEMDFYFPRGPRSQTAATVSVNPAPKLRTAATTATNPGAASTRSNAALNPRGRSFTPSATKPAEWQREWFEPQRNPPRLTPVDRALLAHTGRCWSCRGSNYRASDSCCPNYASHNGRGKSLNEVAGPVMEEDRDHCFLSSLVLGLEGQLKLGRHLVVSAKVHQQFRTTPILVDNGSEVEAIDPSLVRTLNLPTLDLATPIPLHLANGTLYFTVTQIALFNCDIDGHTEQLAAYIAPLARYKIVLGDHWLATHNPHVDFTNRTRTFNSPYCFAEGCLPRGTPCTVHARGSKALLTKTTAQIAGDPITSISIVSARRFTSLAAQHDHHGYLVMPRDGRKHLCVSTTNAVRPEDYDTFMTNKEAYTIDQLKKRVPEKYHSVIEVVMKHEADTLPPHRPEDHDIQLVDGATPPFAKSYRPMTEQELDVVWKYIQEQLGKGFIRSSSSQTAAPLLIVRKPNGGLRSYINNSLSEYLDIFCIAYLDDVLIYSDSEEHTEHVLKVLRRLRDRGLQIDIDNYELDTQEVKYLGLIVTTNGIRMDPEKVAFFSKMTPAETNFMIYDKELLAIVRSFETWRPELASVVPSNPVKVYTDHRNLQHFMTTKQLNRRQVRWAEFLSEFNFKIMYRPSKQGEKPHTLTRRSQDLPQGADDARKKERFQTLLPSECLDEAVQKDLRIVSTRRRRFHTLPPDSTTSLQSTQAPPAASNPDSNSSSALSDPSDILSTPEGFTLPLTGTHKMTNWTLLTSRTINWTTNRTNPQTTEGDDKMPLEALIEEAYENDRVTQAIIKPKDKGKRKLPKIAIEQGVKISMGEVTIRYHFIRNYFWLRMKQDVIQYTNFCATCKRAKARTTQAQGLLRPLPVPNRKWLDISMDIAEDLPACTRRGREFRHVLVVIDCLTKAKIFESLATKSVDELVEVMHRCVLCEVKCKLSTVYHPETDGQSEAAVKGLKNYICAYVNFAQDDWVDYLPVAQFTTNDHVSETTGMTPFFANYGFYPGTGAEPPGSLSHATHPEMEAADRLRESQLLAPKALGPWLIVRNFDNKAYELQLPDYMLAVGITPVFHLSLLRLGPTPEDVYPGQHEDPQEPVMIVDVDTQEEHPEWTVREVVDCRMTR